MKNVCIHCGEKIVKINECGFIHYRCEKCDKEYTANGVMEAIAKCYGG